MNSNEGISMAKMAVSVLILCLLLSGVMLLWYLNIDINDSVTDSWAKAVNSSASDRLWDLCSQTQEAIDNNTNAFPLVTNTANALAEYTEEGVVFIVIEHCELDGNTWKAKKADVYIYSNDSDSILFGSDNIFTKAHDYTYRKSVLPVSTASTKLLTNYSKYRCEVERVNVNVTSTGSYLDTGSNEGNFLAYVIRVHVE